MTTDMTIVDYCVKNNIKWFPIWLQLIKDADGKTKKVLRKIEHESYAMNDKSMPSQSDFEKHSDEIIQKRQLLLNDARWKDRLNHIAMDTRVVHHIDIDTPDYSVYFDDLCNDAPYFTSTTKSYGKHILIKDANFKPSSKRHQVINKNDDGIHIDGVELLCGQWSYAPKDGFMFNADADVYNFNNIAKIVVGGEKLIVKARLKQPQATINTEEQKQNNNLANYDKFTKMKDCYSTARLADYKNFMDFTVAIKICFGEMGRDIWHEICSKSQGYDKYKNDEKWNTLKLNKKDIGFGSLCYWAREDSPAIYNALFGEKMNWNLSEAEFARQFKKVCFADNVVFTGKGKDPEGYMFNGIYWVELSLHNAELHKGKFDQLYNWYMEQLKKEQNEIEEDLYEKLKAKLNTLNSFITRNAVIKIFKSDNFMENVEWNLNRDLFVFEDAVYSLKLGKFVDANPLDYMNISCGKKYNTQIPEADIATAKKAIVSFCKGIVRATDYEYLMKQTASFLKQENKEEKGYFWLGRGRNGKGTLTEILDNVLGAYVGNLNMEYYTTYSKEADKPNQNLFNCRNARVLMSSEVSDTDAFNKPVKFISANFKNTTGQDKIYARELGSKRTAYFTAGKILIQTNKMPEFSKIDTSLKERIVVQEFPYTFTDDADLLKADPEKYKIKDTTLKENFKSETYRIAMTQLMFEFYKEYQKEFIIPPSVVNFTKSYFAEHSVKSFIENYYIPAEGGKITLKQIITDYKNETDKTISNKDLYAELLASGYDVVKPKNIYKLVGYKEKEEEEMEEFVEDEISEECKM